MGAREMPAATKLTNTFHNCPRPHDPAKCAQKLDISAPIIWNIQRIPQRSTGTSLLPKRSSTFRPVFCDRIRKPIIKKDHPLSTDASLRSIQTAITRYHHRIILHKETYTPPFLLKIYVYSVMIKMGFPA